ncbi:MAG: PD40 domain-containing protein [Burkholderiales bacterium]|nr:PD40 domain-containing protein [Anaerolineae bacterium]
MSASMSKRQFSPPRSLDAPPPAFDFFRHGVGLIGFGLLTLVGVFTVLTLGLSRTLLHDNHELTFISERGGNADIYLFDIGRSILHDLTRSEAWERALAWSSDGKRLVYQSNVSGDWELYLLDLDTGTSAGGPVRLTRNNVLETHFAWLPGDEQISFTAGGSGNIFTLDVNAARANPVADDMLQPVVYADLWLWYPALSPDGQQVAFLSLWHGRYGVFLMNPDSTNIRWLADSSPRGNEIVWSPDGQRLAYTLRGNIFTVATDGGIEADRLRISPFNEVEAIDFPIHRSLVEPAPPAFMLDTGIPTTVSEARQVTQAGGWEPSWSPDGEQIAFMSFRDGNAEIYLLDTVPDADAAVESARRLTAHIAGDYSPLFRPRPAG